MTSKIPNEMLSIEVPSPSKYDGNPLSQTIWRNVTRIINYSFDGKVRLLDKYIVERTRGTEFKKLADFSKKYSGTDRAFNVKDALIIESCLGLEPGCLLQPIKKEAVYIFLNCAPSTTNDVMEKLKKEPLVDECATVAGEFDIFVRVFGAREDVSDFVLNKIPNTGATLRISTHFAFTSWQRYSHRNNPYRKPNRPRFLDANWTLPPIGTEIPPPHWD